MRSKGYLVTALAVLVFFLICPISGAGQTSTSQKGKLIVRVLLGDNNTPSKDAFVYVRGDLGQTSGAVSATQLGRFEISLKPGLYDVFVSEGSSLPMCKRIEIIANHTRVWSAKLEVDDDHLTRIEEAGKPGDIHAVRGLWINGNVTR